MIDGAVSYEPIPEKYDVYLQRPTSLAFDDDNNLYVLDIEARLVFVWDQNGHFSGILGQPGEGPGEFSFAEWNYHQAHISCLEDFIYVFDGGRKRVLIFDADRQFLRSVPLPDFKGRVRYFGMTHDGHALVVGQEYLNRTHPTIHAMLYGSDWQLQKELKDHPDKSFEIKEDGRIAIHVFEPRLVSYCDPIRDEIILGFGGKNWFDIFDAEGNHKKRVSFQMSRRKVEQDDIEEYKRSSFLREQNHFVLSFRDWWPFYQQVLPYGSSEYLIVNVSSVDKVVSGIMIDRDGNTLDQVELACGENGGLFGSRGKIIAIRNDDEGDFVLEQWRPSP